MNDFQKAVLTANLDFRLEEGEELARLLECKRKQIREEVEVILELSPNFLNDREDYYKRINIIL